MSNHSEMMAYQIRMSPDDCTCTVTIRSETPISVGDLIQALIDIADEQEMNAENGGDVADH
jgi:hypothetical protein